MFAPSYTVGPHEYLHARLDHVVFMNTLHAPLDHLALGIDGQKVVFRLGQRIENSQFRRVQRLWFFPRWLFSGSRSHVGYRMCA
jgi:hypothetical protein